MEAEKSTRDRVRLFLKDNNMSAREFQNRIGVSVSYVHNMGDTINSLVLARIEEVFPEINIKWLTSGVGEMYKPKRDLIKAKKIENGTDNSIKDKVDVSHIIPLLPISAQAGSLNDFTASVQAFDCELVVSPVKDAELAITVTGESMSPEYPNGSRILIKKINHKAFIDWGKTYVLDTCNGTVLKRIFPCENEGTVKCVSVNPEYPSFEVEMKDIYGMYAVLMCLSLK